MARPGPKPVVPQKLMDRYAAGQTTLAAIARRVGRSVHWVWCQLRQAGVVKPRRGRPARSGRGPGKRGPHPRRIEFPGEVLCRYETGEMTLADVARCLRISASSAWRQLRRAGVAMKGKRGRRPLRIEFPAEILRRYEAGDIGIAGLARLMGVSDEVIARELRRAGVDTSCRTSQLRIAARHYKQPRPPPAVLVELYRQGQSLSQLGRQFGVTHERIRQILAAQGQARRAPGGQPAPQREDSPGQP